MKADRSSLWGAVVLIALGIIFLLQNNGVRSEFTDRWWALLILIPAVTAWSHAYALFRQAGHWTSAAMQRVIGGCVPALIAGIFLLDLDWSRLWPLFLVLAGLSGLVTQRKDPERPAPPPARP